MSSSRPSNQLIDVNFYKISGKWYAGSQAVVNHFLFQDGFKQDIVNTQDCLVDGWQEDAFVVVTSAPEHVNGFFERIFFPGEFSGYVKEVE